MIAVKGLSYSYTLGKTIHFPDFEVSAEQPCLLLGESGSGKTTLLHLAGGLLRSQNGSILIKDTDITGLSASALDHFRGQSIGFTFQRNHLIGALSVEKNLMLAPFLAGIRQDHKRIDELLRRLGLAEKRNARIHELSQG